MAQSGLYGRPHPPASIKEAVIHLGVNITLNIALSVGLCEPLKLSVLSKDLLARYWQTALQMAQLAYDVADESDGYVPPETAYLCGLLANFGDLVAAEFYSQHYRELLFVKSINRHCSPDCLELTILPFTTPELAGWVLTQWGLPERICTGVKLQYQRLTPLSEEGHILRLARQRWRASTVL